MDSISDVLSSAYTDTAFKHVLGVLDSATSSAQHTVRTQVERSVLDKASAVLEQMRPLNASVSQLSTRVERTKIACTQIESILAEEKQHTEKFAREAEFARSEIARLQQRQRTLSAFMKTMYISPEEREILSGSNQHSSELSPAFFTALERVRHIQDTFAVALLAEYHSAGEVLMQETSKLLDSAYGRVKTAIESDLKAGGRRNLQKYMSLLADRPLLFKSVLESESSSRRTRITREFSQFAAQEQGNATAIPARYLSSVLAWVHAGIVNEFEHISLLFDAPGEDMNSRSTLHQLLDTSDTKQIIAELVNKVLSAIETPLRQRINALVVAQSSPATVDELQNVLMFYSDMLHTRFDQPAIARVLEQLDTGMDRQFSHLLDVQKLKWEAKVDVACAVAETHDRGFFQNDQRTLARLDSLLQMPNTTNNIERLNTIDYAISQLAGYVIVQAKLDVFQEEQHSLEAMQAKQEAAALRRSSSLDEYEAGILSMREFTIAFDKFLASVDLSLTGLNSPTIARRIADQAVNQFVSEYEFAVKEPIRSAEEVRSILL